MTTSPVMTPSMFQFLGWLSIETRTYADTMEAWQTSCPRFSVWEDATIAGLVTLRRVDGETIVVPTDLGRELLDAH